MGNGVSVGALSARRLLLVPFVRMLRNRLFPKGKPAPRTWLIGGIGGLIAVALYLVSAKVVGYFHSQSELGIILSTKIFHMAWIILFSMLVFSSTVSAVSSVFLSRDNEIVFSAPVRPSELFFSRFVTLTFHTSWMMFVFSIPVFSAYGVVFDVDVLYWPLMFVAILGTIGSATGTGLVITILLVRVFPAKRTKEIVLYLSLCFGLFVYFMFRLMRPEELVNPQLYPEFVEYLSALSRPVGPYLPPAWAGDLLSAYLLDREVDWVLVGLLLTSGPVVFFAGEWCMERWFFSGYSKSQESFGGYRRFSRRRIYHGSVFRWVLAKEGKSFFRDSSEWSQVFMIAALVVVYLYNFKVLPVDRSFLSEGYLVNVISFLNIGLVGFVITSLAARFVYPSIGAEGGAFTFIRSAPLSMARFLFYKYVFYSIPFTIIAVVLVTLSDHMLHVEGPMRWVSVITTLIVTWTVTAVALGFGASHADFRAENRTAALGSIGAVLFLFAAIAFQLVVIIMGAYPAFRLVKAWVTHDELGVGDRTALFAWSLGSVVLAVGLSWVTLGRGKKALERME